MKVVLLLLVIALLVLVPVITSISCYSGIAGLYATITTCDVCTTVTNYGVTTKACYGTGSGSVTCSSYPSVTCCSTSLCNGAKINGTSVFLIIVAKIVGLFHAL